jgi:hypothetical protein
VPAKESSHTALVFFSVPRRTRPPLELLQHGTHTFSNSGTFAWHEDQKTGTPAEITLGWSYDVTVQVLDQDGVPIP